MTFGASQEQALREYLHSMEKTHLGQISGRMFREFADEFYAKWEAQQKPKPARRTAVRKVGDERNSIPPTVEMVRQRIRQMGYTFSAERFMGHYDSNGWKVGKVPMVDWFGACVTFQGEVAKRPVGDENPVKQGIAIPEPANWRTIIANDAEDGMHAAGEWSAIHPYYQKRIARKCAGQAEASLGQLLNFPQTG